jgi:hypothetical protein
VILVPQGLLEFRVLKVFRVQQEQLVFRVRRDLQVLQALRELKDCKALQELPELRVLKEIQGQLEPLEFKVHKD